MHAGSITTENASVRERTVTPVWYCPSSRADL